MSKKTLEYFQNCHIS